MEASDAGLLHSERRVPSGRLLFCVLLRIPQKCVPLQPRDTGRGHRGWVRGCLAIQYVVGRATRGVGGIDPNAQGGHLI